MLLCPAMFLRHSRTHVKELSADKLKVRFEFLVDFVKLGLPSFSFRVGLLS